MSSTFLFSNLMATQRSVCPSLERLWGCDITSLERLIQNWELQTNGAEDMSGIGGRAGGGVRTGAGGGVGEGPPADWGSGGEAKVGAAAMSGVDGMSEVGD